MEAWKIIFLSKWVICMFHVNLPGCNWLVATKRFLEFSARTLGKDPMWRLHIFQMGWNHQLDTVNGYVPPNQLFFNRTLSINSKENLKKTWIWSHTSVTSFRFLFLLVLGSVSKIRWNFPQMTIYIYIYIGWKSPPPRKKARWISLWDLTIISISIWSIISVRILAGNA